MTTASHPLVGPDGLWAMRQAARATHERSLLRVSALCVGIAIALSGCEEQRGDAHKVADTGLIGSVSKACDEGRAIYTYKSGYAGGIAVVPNAPECAK